MVFRKLVFISFLMLITASFVSATYISLSSSVDLERIVNSTVAEANISIFNDGDEPAYDVIVEPISYQGINAEQVMLGTINPNSTAVGTITLQVDENSVPGKYAIGLLIRYNDLNNYPFTFVTPVTFFYQTPVQSNVVGLLNELEIAGDETQEMILTIQNRDYKPHDVTIKLYTPNQISVDEAEKKITLQQSSESTVTFQVSSLGALPGGNFFVFATIDYEEDGMHCSAISSNGRIITAKERSFMGMLVPLIIVVVAVLIVVLIITQLRSSKPGAAKKNIPRKSE